MCDIIDIHGYFARMDTQRVVYSSDHDFLLGVFKKSRFGENFIYWIKILLNDHNHVL